jgi:hypothetical protein
LQASLIVLGFDLGISKPNGELGIKTRQALQEFRQFYLPNSDTQDELVTEPLAALILKSTDLARVDAARFRIGSDVLAAIRLGSIRTGVDFSFLMEMARVESNFNPTVRAPKSSATGLFQFKDNAWLESIRTFGADYGLKDYATRVKLIDDEEHEQQPIVRDPLQLEVLALRLNPRLSTLMAAENIKRNLQILSARTRHAPVRTNLYLAHFLGPDAAVIFLKTLDEEPATIAGEIFPKEAEINPRVFQNRQRKPRTLTEVYRWFESKFNTARVAAVADTKPAAADADTKPVTWDNWVRAETDKMFKRYADVGGFGKFFNIRKPTPIDAQKVVRMNRNTMYSFGVFDLTTPVTITKPDTGDRFQSMMVVNQDEYVPIPVVYKPGKYTLTQDKIGSRYTFVVIRTFVDASDPADIKKANAIQDQIKVEQASVGKFEVPNWDKKSQDKLRSAISVLAATMKNTNKSFGPKGQVDPIAHLLGAELGWGGNPPQDATYLNVTPEKNDGKTPYTLTVKDVPVDGFWSISLYNGKGFFVQNQYNAYSINNITGKKAKDGSITIHFGGDPKQPNYLPIMDGWNYIVRMYEPQQQILDGKWKFPAPKPVN